MKWALIITIVVKNFLGGAHMVESTVMYDSRDICNRELQTMRLPENGMAYCKPTDVKSSEGVEP